MQRTTRRPAHLPPVCRQTFRQLHSMRPPRRQLRAVKRRTAAALLWAAGGCMALLATAPACFAADNPADWLARTDRALATLNYEGVFVHEHAGETEKLRVIHRVGSDGVSVRLVE